MEMEITLPDEVPVMTLPNTALFPQALMPLHIFEPRYRFMLRDVLSGDRLFAVAGLQQSEGEADSVEQPHRIAAVGIIRACQKNDDGTSNLLLQGLCRVEIVRIIREQPYRLIQVRALASEPGATPATNDALRRELARLLRVKLKLASGPKPDLAPFLEGVDDPESFVDIAAFNLCEDAACRQRLLETLDINRRLILFRDHLQREIAGIRLRRTLQGPLSDEQIGGN